MKAKKILAVAFTLIGAIALAGGVLSTFNKAQEMGKNPIGVALVGGLFFVAGMALVRSVGVP
ncbi:MAG: hypothetical protein ACJAZ9_000817 [Neolewinella sp.]|jgi:hypothetical protein